MLLSINGLCFESVRRFVACLWEFYDLFPSDWGLKSVIFVCRSCHKNFSLYEVLQLEKQIDISDVASYSQKFGIHDRIKELVNNIKLDYDINIITPRAQVLLLKLAESKLNEISFMSFNNVVRTVVIDQKLRLMMKLIVWPFLDRWKNYFDRFNTVGHSHQRYCW